MACAAFSQKSIRNIIPIFLFVLKCKTINLLFVDLFINHGTCLNIMYGGVARDRAKAEPFSATVNHHRLINELIKCFSDQSNSLKRTQTIVRCKTNTLCLFPWICLCDWLAGEFAGWLVGWPLPITPAAPAAAADREGAHPTPSTRNAPNRNVE